MLLATKVSSVFPFGKIPKGDVGIEIEAEYLKPIISRKDERGLRFWDLKADGSLRNNGYEFVLKNPIPIMRLDECLLDFNTFIEKEKLEYVHSNRCSVHIHNNILDFTVSETLTAISLYWVLEPLLMNVCGMERRSNNFCLTLQDADAVHSNLVTNIKSGSYFANIGNETYRYSSLNIEAIPKFGSLEVRTMRGTNDVNLIKTWASINHELFKAARTFGNPAKLLKAVSEKSPTQFLGEIFTRDPYLSITESNRDQNFHDLYTKNIFYLMEIVKAKTSWDPESEVSEMERIRVGIYEARLLNLYKLGLPSNEETSKIAEAQTEKDMLKIQL